MRGTWNVYYPHNPYHTTIYDNVTYSYLKIIVFIFFKSTFVLGFTVFKCIFANLVYTHYCNTPSLV